MSISIVSCPKCNTFLLSDTAQCHRCRYVLNPARAAQFRDNSLPSDATIQQDSERCRQCGETYRKGLVRCWSCGAFTRPEIEEAYYKLLQGHAHEVNSAGQHYELPEISAEDIRKAYQDEDAQRPASPSTVVAAVDEDFELAGNLSLLEDPAPLHKLPESKPAASNGTPVEKPVETAPVAKAPEKPADDADSLLDHAKQQQTADQKARRAKLGDGFVIYCPMGCKIRVQERHRGKIGRCPKCQSTFVVPVARQTALAGSTKPDAAGPKSDATSPSVSEKYSRWMKDVHLHKVIPQKLRIKADSLLKDFQPVDLAFDADGLLMLGLQTAGGMFGKKAMKPDAARAAIQEQLQTSGKTEGLPAGFQQQFSPDAVRQIAVSQPAPPDSESLWGEIPVFGAGRAAVRLPKFDDKTVAYLSFPLTQFREFSQNLADIFGIVDFGAGCGIPLVDEYKTHACHVSKKLVKELQNLTWYQKDPDVKLEVSGYRCKVCSAVVSEGARAAQKLGGANGKGIAKAKCPKCTKPMGNQPLYVLPAKPKAAEDEAPASDSDAAMAPAVQPAPAAV